MQIRPTALTTGLIIHSFIALFYVYTEFGIDSRLMLRKRTVIESVNDFLKNMCNIEHSRHRSITNFLVNLLSALAAYSFFPKKPSIYSASHFHKNLLCLVD